MNKILKRSLTVLLLIFVASVSLTSCKDDDDKVNPSSKLIGTWFCDFGLESFTYVFNADNTGREIWESPYGSGYDNFTWRATESIVTLYFEDEDPCIVPYVISSDGKTMTFDGDVYIKR